MRWWGCCSPKFRCLPFDCTQRTRDLFDDFDRALAEAAFRISIIPPIVLILFSIPFQPAVSALWAVVCVIAGFVGFYALWTRAATKVRNANDIVIQALVLDIVTSPLLGRLDAITIGTERFGPPAGEPR